MPAEVDRTAAILAEARAARAGVHIVNVGGAGMSAIAVVLAEQGVPVTGTDSRETPFLAAVRAAGATVVVGDRHGPLTATTGLVVTSTATPPDHADVVGARAEGVPVVHRSDLLTAICADRDVLAVAGTHGKSTTAAMLATVLSPTGAGYLVGTRVTGLGASAVAGSAPAFVVEADESDGTFLHIGARLGVVTNVEADHLAYWGTEDALVAAFQRFVAALDGPAVLCLDDPGSAALVDHASEPVTYGTDPAADYVVHDVAAAGLGVAFRLRHGSHDVAVEVPAAPGVHNARNAAAAIAAAHRHGTSLADAAAALATFAGVARRFEPRGEAAGVTFVDSYDHLPTEVRAALAAAAAAPFERVVCLFQPHRVTRTRDLWPTFADAFVDADVLGVCGLYTAGETPVPGVTGKLVLDAVLDAHPRTDAAWLPDLGAAEEWALVRLRPGDLCITLNAGDLTTLPDRLVSKLAARDRRGRP